MSNNIDNRVVNMRFDNKQFEGGVQTSIKSLDRLKNGLNFGGAIKGLSNLERAGRSFSLAGVSTGVDLISSRFTILGIMGVTALQNITNSAVNLGKSMAAALTIDPLKMGLSEYETKMDAIQTIMTNTELHGTTLIDVNRALDELNIYADKTIYNFAQMTDNIGKFTAAGLGLEDSVIAIKGLSNVAAGFGVNAVRMAGATYQMSQALSAGVIKLMDWRSLEQAGMGGPRLQNSLRQTAKELGIVVDASIPFRASLETGWLTTDVFIKTMEKMAKDESLIAAATNVTTFTKLLGVMRESMQSGWAQSWENIIGDRDESTLLFTKINDIFGSIVGTSADARNAMLAFWKANDGRYSMIEALFNTFKGLQEILAPIGKAFSEVFPPMTGPRLVEISERIRDITRNFKIGEETANNIRRTFKGLFAVLNIGVQIFTAIAGGIKSLIHYLIPAGEGLLSFSGGIGDWLVALDEAIKKSGIFKVVVEKLVNVIKIVADGVKTAVSTIFGAIKSFGNVDMSGLDNLSEQVSLKFEPFTTLGELIHNIFSKLAELFKKTMPVFVKVGSILGDVFSKLGTAIGDAFINGGFSAVLDFINKGLLATILLGIRTMIANFGGFTGILQGLQGTLDGLQSTLQAYQTNLKAGVLLKIAAAIGILALALIYLSKIDSERLTSSLAAITVMFAQLFASMAIFSRITGVGGFLGMVKMSIIMMGLSVAILIFTSAVTKLAKLDWEGVAKGLLSVASLSAVLVIASKALSKSRGALIKGSLGLILFTTSILILTSAVERLGQLDTGALIKGLIGVGTLVAGIVLFMKKTNISGMAITKSVGLLLMVSAIGILATVVKKFSDIDTGALIKGLTGVAVLLTMVSVFVKATGNTKSVITSAIGLTILGVAMNIFAKAIKTMGLLSLEQIGKGLLTLAGALVIITTALNFMPKGILLKAAGLVVIASALTILVKALHNMSGMSWEQVAKGLVTLAGSLTIIAVAMKFMKGVIPGAAALLIVAAALSVLIPMLVTLGSKSLGEIGKGLLALAGIFVVLGLVGLALAPLIPVILALAVAITILGVGVLAIGAGLLIFSAGVSALAVSGAAVAVSITAIVASVISLFPLIIKTIGEGLVLLVTIIGQYAPKIVGAIVKFIEAIISELMPVIPKVVEAVSKLLISLLETMVTFIPKVVDAGIKIILGFLQGIANNINDIIPIAIDIVSKFINGIASMMPQIIQTGFNLILSFINGLADAIRKNTGLMITAIKNLISAVIDAGLKTLFGSMSLFRDAGAQIIKGLLGGIRDNVSVIVDGVRNVANRVMSTFKRALGIQSPSRVFQDYGLSIVNGLRAGIKKNTPAAVTESKTMAKEVTKASSDELVKANKNDVEERKRANREVVRSKKESAEAQKEIEKEAFRHSVDWIDERKYYNQLSLKEELAAWERVQKRYKAGTEERKRANREVFRVKNELIERQKELDNDYYNSTKEINSRLKDDIKSLNDEYEHAVESRANSLYNAYGLFDKVEKRESVSGMELVSNLQSQVKEFDFWQSNMEALAKKGVDEGLIKELQAMGPKASAQIRALNTLSSGELDIYVSLWRRKHSEARSQAVDELHGLRLDTNIKIAELNTQAEKELEAYKQTWIQKTRELTGGVNAEFLKMSTDTAKTIDILKIGVEKEFTELTENVKTIFNTPNWEGLGANIVLGITAGVKSKAAVLAAETAKTARLALQAARRALGIKSPSKEFEKIGMYVNQGLVIGLKRYSNLVDVAGENSGNTVIDSLKRTLSNVSSLISGGIDLMPTIRPVVDMTDIERGLTSTFNKSRGINVSATGRKAAGVNSAMGSRNGGFGSTVNETTNNMDDSRIVIHNQYVVRNDNDIRKISQDQKTLLDRYSFAKGVPVNA